MASIDEVDQEVEIKRPKRSCTQKEAEQNEKLKNSDSESDFETPENSHDEDFTLNKPRKLRKKKKKVPKEPKEKKVNRVEYPSYFSVMQAQQALEDRFAVRNIVESNDYDDYSSDDNEEIKENVTIEELPEPEAEIIEECLPEPTKKKRIVIRPWNPQWYQIQH